jgi:hypothetical protein
VIAPGAIVGQVHPLLVLGIGRHEGAVHVDLRQREERGRLVRPSHAAGVIEEVLERGNALGGEAAAEVPCGGRVGEATGAESIEEVGVVAAEFEILQASTVAQGVVGEVEDVVGFVVGQVDLEDMEVSIKPVDEAQLTGEQVKGADAAVADAVAAVTDLEVNVAGGEHGFGATTEIGLVQAALDLALAVVELATYLLFHLKTLVTGVVKEPDNSSNTAEMPRVFEFFQNSSSPRSDAFAYSRSSSLLKKALAE